MNKKQTKIVWNAINQFNFDVIKKCQVKGTHNRYRNLKSKTESVKKLNKMENISCRHDTVK